MGPYRTPKLTIIFLSVFFLLALFDVVKPAEARLVPGTGNIVVSWNENPESDLAGYKVHRASNYDMSEYQIFDNGLATERTDYLPENTVQYYAVTAYDYVGNQSERSDVIYAYRSGEEFISGGGEFNPPADPVFSAPYSLTISANVMQSDTAVVVDSGNVLFGWKQDAKLDDNTPVSVDSIDGWRIVMDGKNDSESWFHVGPMFKSDTTFAIALAPDVYRINVYATYAGITGKSASIVKHLLVKHEDPPPVTEEPDYSTRDVIVEMKVKVQ